MAAGPTTDRGGGLSVVPRGLDWRALALGLAFATIWSSAFTSSRIVVEYWPPFLVLTVRFLFSGVLALGIGLALGQRIRLTRGEWGAVVAFGICQNALYLGLFHYAMQTVQAGLAAIIASALPLCVAAFGRLFLGQRLPPVAVAGLLAGFAGVLVIMTGRLGHGLDWAGVGVCVVGVIALAVATLTLRNAAAGGQPLDRRGPADAGRRGGALSGEPRLRDLARRLRAAVLRGLPLLGGGLGRGGDDDLVRPGAADRRDPGRDLPLSQPVPRGRRSPRRCSASG